MDSIVDQTGHFAYAFAHVSAAYSYDVVTILWHLKVYSGLTVFLSLQCFEIFIV